MSAPAGQSVGQPASQSGGLFPQPATLALELWPAESTFQLDSLGSARLVSLSLSLPLFSAALSGEPCGGEMLRQQVRPL